MSLSWYELPERKASKVIIDGLSLLSEIYDDKNLINFVNDLRRSDMYIQAFEKSVKLAELRKVPEKDILKTKTDIDSYFRGANHE